MEIICVPVVILFVFWIMLRVLWGRREAAPPDAIYRTTSGGDGAEYLYPTRLIGDVEPRRGPTPTPADVHLERLRNTAQDWQRDLVEQAVMRRDRAALEDALRLQARNQRDNAIELDDDQPDRRTPPRRGDSAWGDNFHW